MWDINIFAARLLSALTGSLLAAILLVVALRQRARTAAGWLLAGLLGGALGWQVRNALHDLASVAGQGWAARLGARGAGAAWLAAVLLLGAILLALAYRRGRPPLRAFSAWTAGALAAWAAALWTVPNGALEALASLLPLTALTVFVTRFNVFGLLLSQRILFLFTLSLASALYLVVVRFLAGWLEAEFGAFGPVVEIGLILGAAVTWLPMYQVITRFFSRASRIHVEFSRRVVEEATAILDLRERAQYLVEQVGRIFALRRAALIAGGEPPLVAAHGPRSGALTADNVRQWESWAAGGGRGPIRGSRAVEGFNYIFPLYYQERLTGLLLVDSAPRAFLDEAEETLLGLSSQISLSLESCRLSETKVRLERKLLEQQYLASLGAFAATIAHEVKNPLSSIKTLAQLLREDPGVLARYARELDFIVGATNRLDGCMQQLLTFARPLPKRGEDVALSETLENTAAFLALDGASPGVRVERRIEPGLRLAGSDRKSIEQVALNLLLNAVQASPANGQVLLVAGREPGGAIRVSVADEGPGIPEEMRARVFEPFFTTKPQGTGLGLAIVRKNVQHLGAELELAAPAAGGRGTCVTVVFPREQAAQA